ncbi:MAG TPA: phosphate acyltransferase PlsX [Bryobacteraceae bacterium]|jgi:glycerol-3-phosphate acyltransferase PlsX|nr:phosphate acyltransferase PlsX [Bryobacteraceae bacterium]
MVTIAVDAMGGDKAPVPEVEGAIHAARQYGHRVLLVGDGSAVERELASHDSIGDLPIEIVHAAERITMDDHAAKAARGKKESSMHVCARLVAAGQADGFLSAGNTGACMAIAKMVFGKVPGVDRPALTGVFPTHEGTPVVVLDVGANVDCEPEMLQQFGLMGEIYSRLVLKIARPRVGLLSIGEEEHKGNALTKDATPLLKSLDVNFIGNVEGRDLFSGRVDVIVCDGFVGNVALKVAEGLSEMIRGMLRESLASTVTRKIGYALSRSAYKDFKKRVDYAEYGGAPLLGVKGVCIICHGRSDSNAIKNAIRVAADFASSNMNQRIEEELREFATAG